MKVVMISVQPKFCEKIANGECTILVRKTSPKLETPFKCYIYCTKGKPYLYREANGKKELFLDKGLYKGSTYEDRFLSGKIIGEFICDRMYEFTYNHNVGEYNIGGDSLKRTCLTYCKLENYGKGEPLYGWHISELEIYDVPKELSEFRKTPKVEQCISYCKNGLCADLPYEEFCSNFTDCGRKIFTRPPQSWCYVDKLSD